MADAFGECQGEDVEDPVCCLRKPFTRIAAASDRRSTVMDTLQQLRNGGGGWMEWHG
jgi:hypothetical protein